MLSFIYFFFIHQKGTLFYLFKIALSCAGLGVMFAVWVSTDVCFLLAPVVSSSSSHTYTHRLRSFWVGRTMTRLEGTSGGEERCLLNGDPSVCEDVQGRADQHDLRSDREAPLKMKSKLHPPGRLLCQSGCKWCTATGMWFTTAGVGTGFVLVWCDCQNSSHVPSARLVANDANFRLTNQRKELPEKWKCVGSAIWKCEGVKVSDN